MTIGGDKVTVNKTRSQNHPESKEGKRKRTLYVGNVSFNSTQEDIEEFFNRFGKVVDVYAPRPRDGYDKPSFYFVMFDTEETAIDARDHADGAELMGRDLRVFIKKRPIKREY